VPPEPAIKRTAVFIDGQSLFYAAKKAFGYSYPNYDPKALAEHIATARGWSLTETFFYTGIPDPIDNAFWNHFWTAKLAVMGTRGIQTFCDDCKRSRFLRLFETDSATLSTSQSRFDFREGRIQNYLRSLAGRGSPLDRPVKGGVASP